MLTGVPLSELFTQYQDRFTLKKYVKIMILEPNKKIELCSYKLDKCAFQKLETKINFKRKSKRQ